MFCFAVAVCQRWRLVIWRTRWCPPRRIWRRRLASGRNSWEPQIWSRFESATAHYQMNTWHRLFKHWGDLLLKQIVMSTSDSMKSALENSTVCECLILFVESFWTWMQDQTGPNPDLPSVSIQVLSSPRASDGRTWGHAGYCRRSGALLSLLSALHSQPLKCSFLWNRLPQLHDNSIYILYICKFYIRYSLHIKYVLYDSICTICTRKTVKPRCIQCSIILLNIYI